MTEMTQDFLPNFLKAEAEARESDISYQAWFDHKRRVAMRWFKYYKMAKDQKKRDELARQYNLAATIKQKD